MWRWAARHQFKWKMQSCAIWRTSFSDRSAVVWRKQASLRVCWCRARARSRVGADPGYPAWHHWARRRKRECRVFRQRARRRQLNRKWVRGRAPWSSWRRPSRYGRTQRQSIVVHYDLCEDRGDRLVEGNASKTKSCCSQVSLTNISSVLIYAFEGSKGLHLWHYLTH